MAASSSGDAGFPVLPVARVSARLIQFDDELSAEWSHFWVRRQRAPQL